MLFFGELCFTLRKQMAHWKEVKIKTIRVEDIRKSIGIRQCMQNKGILGVFNFSELKVVFMVEANHNTCVQRCCLVIVWSCLQVHMRVTQVQEPLHSITALPLSKSVFSRANASNSLLCLTFALEKHP